VDETIGSVEDMLKRLRLIAVEVYGLGQRNREADRQTDKKQANEAKGQTEPGMACDGKTTAILIPSARTL